MDDVVKSIRSDISILENSQTQIKLVSPGKEERVADSD